MLSINGPSLVVGSGSLGRFLAARLGISGTHTLLWSLRSPYAISEVLDVKQFSATAHLLQTRYLGKVEQVRPSRAYLAVKAYQLPYVISCLEQMIPSSTPVILTQNSLRSDEWRNWIFKNLFVMTASFVAEAFGPNGVRQTLDGCIGVASFSASADAGCSQIQHELQEAGFHTYLARSWEDILLPKILLASTSAILALRDLPVQVALASPLVREEMLQIMREGKDVFCADFEARPPGLRPAQALPIIDRLLSKVSRGGRSILRSKSAYMGSARTSLQQDLDRRRGQTEVEYINGAISRLGSSVGREAPLNTSLFEIVSEAARLRKSPSELAKEFSSYRFGVPR